MLMFDTEKVAERLKTLRGRTGLSQGAFAKELDRRIGSDNPESEYKKMVLGGDNGAQIVSALERGKRGLTYELAFAYADICGVTLDYILCMTDDELPQHAGIKEWTALSDKAIKTLNQQKSVDPNIAGCISYLLENSVQTLKDIHRVIFSAGADRVSYPVIPQEKGDYIKDSFESSLYHDSEEMVAITQQKIQNQLYLLRQKKQHKTHAEAQQ